MINLSKLEKSARNNRLIYEMAIIAHNQKNNITASSFIGEFNGKKIDEHTPYFLASATKLYVTALIMRLIENNLLQFDTPINRFFSAQQLKGLHKIKNIDYSDKITIENLLAHTSGLPDYFRQKHKDGTIFSQNIIAGNDIFFTIDDVLTMSKGLKPAFPPSTVKRAFYSDTNYQLLGAIIEKISNMSFAKAVEQNIIIPLNLKNSWVFELEGKNSKRKIIPLRNKSSILNIPQAMSSVGADGAMVSSAHDGLIFIKAFFGGQLFSKDLLQLLMKKYRNIFFPLKYGTGIMLFSLPPIMSFFQKQPKLVGHSGISGAFLFAELNEDIFISGTINQISPPSLAYKFLLKAFWELKKQG